MHRKYTSDILVKSRSSIVAAARDACDACLRPDPVVLAVGQACEWRRLTKSLPKNASVTFVGIKDLSSAYLRDVDPDVVVSCLVSRGFDFLDVAHALQSAGYKNCLRIIVPDLPDPGIVLSEARSLCPDLNIDFEIDRTERHALVN